MVSILHWCQFNHYRIRDGHVLPSCLNDYCALGTSLNFTDAYIPLNYILCFVNCKTANWILWALMTVKPNPSTERESLFQILSTFEQAVYFGQQTLIWTSGMHALKYMPILWAT